jgi:hypothetical protein
MQLPVKAGQEHAETLLGKNALDAIQQRMQELEKTDD